MIVFPDPYLIITGIILFGITTILGIYFSSKLNSVKLFIFFFIAAIAVFCPFAYVQSNIDTDYHNAVKNEIEKATCAELPKMYEYYSYYEKKIKSKYLFDCVATNENSLKILEGMK